MPYAVPSTPDVILLPSLEIRCGRRIMERYEGTSRALDARMAAWLTSNSHATVGYHVSCGLERPARRELPHGCGPGWQGRAIAAVLRECYRSGLVNPILEEVEISAIAVLPEPESDDEGPRPPFAPGPRERWEEAVRRAAEAVYGILRHGPASGSAGGDILFTGGTLVAEVDGLEVEQRVDMIWRRPDGALEAVLIFEEPLNARPRPAVDDWRCVLAASTVREVYGQTPDVHTVWVSGNTARVSHIPDEALNDRLGTLSRVLARASTFRGLDGSGEGAFYRFTDEPPHFQAARGNRGQRPRGSARRRSD